MLSEGQIDGKQAQSSSDSLPGGAGYALEGPTPQCITLEAGHGADVSVYKGFKCLIKTFCFMS